MDPRSASDDGMALRGRRTGEEEDFGSLDDFEEDDAFEDEDLDEEELDEDADDEEEADYDDFDEDFDDDGEPRRGGGRPRREWDGRE